MFGVVLELSEVPSVGRNRKSRFLWSIQVVCSPLHENLLTLHVCGPLLVVGHSSAGEDHCGEDGKR